MKIYVHVQVRTDTDRTSIDINGETSVIGVLKFK